MCIYVDPWGATWSGHSPSTPRLNARGSKGGLTRVCVVFVFNFKKRLVTSAVIGQRNSAGTFKPSGTCNRNRVASVRCY